MSKKSDCQMCGEARNDSKAGLCRACWDFLAAVTRYNEHLLMRQWAKREYLNDGDVRLPGLVEWHVVGADDRSRD